MDSLGANLRRFYCFVWLGFESLLPLQLALALLLDPEPIRDVVTAVVR
jgi:hypothetical protein